ncbi:transcriptional regulator, DeoR family [Quadrisphaera granulorum]|uniref:Lactose phosphotransferase system repressor n=1 Tax=Quadrisphaera granulorum TaxID=317664 RepID=A0A315ZVY0_9ACTN|nr:DeoR/GlpR family DNA-binding transcription regulator [Quadrisphaera granulorum]PWJ49028.1 DeoR family transcriptional regulator [Quadrisphaera granulorum]SZE98238.1 transcriptional regulator, DeoR family [Quadrisphaera granulorum]
MQTRQRHEQILERLDADRFASVNDLAEALQVSPSTVRRDLQQLGASGELRRTHGGAVVLDRPADRTSDGALEHPYATTAQADADLKAAMGRAAADLVPDGAVVALDIGTTTPLVARHLAGRPVTVITSNLAVLDELRDDPAVDLVLLGGSVRRNFQTLVGALTLQALASISCDVAVLSCTGVRPDGRVVDDMSVEAPTKEGLLAAATQTVLLASHAKFPGTGSLQTTSLEAVDVLVTTTGAPQEALDRVAAAGGRVVVA